MTVFSFFIFMVLLLWFLISKIAWIKLFPFFLDNKLFPLQFYCILFIDKSAKLKSKFL